MIDIAAILASEKAITVITGIVTFIIGILIIKRLEKVFERGFRRSMPKGMAKSVSRLTYYGMVFLVSLIALDAGGFKIESLLLAGGVMGVAIGFASKTTVSNLISGLFLYVDRPFDIGDSVDFEGVGGTVQDITPLSTRITTWDGPMVRVPNETVFNSNIKNFKKVVVRRFEYKIGVSYDSNIDTAMKTIEKVLQDEPYVLKEPAVSVFMSNMLDSSIEITVKAWTPASKNYSVKTQILKKFYDALTKAKIEIPYPQMDVHLRK
ncbi:MAG: mechanosensitive ion channel family protein [Candidatus Altiarchaeota archaeon]|nr:mechanosensitive ion channel family protein [Candidatus Altiarchaeota archaeon]